jgi:hypothetical protein
VLDVVIYYLCIKKENVIKKIYYFLNILIYSSHACLTKKKADNIKVLTESNIIAFNLGS